MGDEVSVESSLHRKKSSAEWLMVWKISKFVHTKVNISSKGDDLERLDVSDGSSDALFASSVGLEVVQGADVTLPLAAHANVDHTELESLKVD